ncbi:hypothetical protein Y032_0370g109 [Ancylostoma ceylanicum]|uniref:Uncharacterized protein n=1 Tax=Ancylostoma ceylanicum TaxID=53326 RepID=A0A016RUI4_9BILA|nr:hypothetical protein Y032_0370g109 [Ancylostoma ceylanicum]
MLFVFFGVAALLLGAECRVGSSLKRDQPSLKNKHDFDYLGTTLVNPYKIRGPFPSTSENSAEDHPTPISIEDHTADDTTRLYHKSPAGPNSEEYSTFKPSTELASEETGATRAPTVVCKNDTSFSRLPALNSLRHADIYRHYQLGSDEFNAKFLLDALERIVKHSHEEIEDAMWKINDINFLTGDFDEEATFSDLARHALNDSKGTIFEDLVRFKVANALQFHAVVYLKTLIARDFGDYHPQDRMGNFAILRDLRSARKRRQIGKATRILRASLAKGEVPYVEIEDAIELLRQFRWMGESFEGLLNEQSWISSEIRKYLGKYVEDSHPDSSNSDYEY